MEGEQPCYRSYQKITIPDQFFHAILEKCGEAQDADEGGDGREGVLRLPVSTALKLRFGKSVAAQLLLLAINATLPIAGAGQGGDNVLPSLHTLTGSWPLFLSCFVSVPVYTQQSQRRRGRFAPQGNWLLAQWFCVLYCKPEEPRYNLCLSVQLQGCHSGFLRSWVQIFIAFFLDKSPCHQGEVCLGSNSPLPLSAPLVCFSHPL